MTRSASLPPLPEIEPEQAVEVIIGFIRAQMEQTGFERIVLGLSGGVDSATVAFLCARAVSPDNLLAVRMPFRTSSEASEADALKDFDFSEVQTLIQLLRRLSSGSQPGWPPLLQQDQRPG